MNACPAVGGSGTSGDQWVKHTKKHCAAHTLRQTYYNLASAEKACAATDKCDGVYDSGCDGRGYYKLCDDEHVLATSSVSCVYSQDADDQH